MEPNESAESTEVKLEEFPNFLYKFISESKMNLLLISADLIGTTF